MGTSQNLRRASRLIIVTLVLFCRGAQSATCPVPEKPINGTVEYPHLDIGSVASYFCNFGYVANGSTSATCDCNNNQCSWSNLPPDCNLVNCGFPVVNPNSQITCENGTLYTDLCSYACDVGYNMTGSVLLKCMATSDWDLPSPVCSPVDCGLPISPVNGSVIVGNTTYQSSAAFSCDDGFDLNGPYVLSCNSSAVWNNTYPTCQVKDCGHPPNVSDGSVNYTLTTYQSAALYSCNTGYFLTGNSVMTCNASGLWDMVAPACQIVDCGLPASPVNGSVIVGNTTYQSSAAFSCDDGFDLVGPSVLSCNAYAVWNDTYPTCQVKDCGPPAEPFNGSVSFNGTTYGSSATFTCDDGFDLQGPVMIECNASALWNDMEPYCVVKDCGAPPNTADGYVNYTSTTYLSNAVYSCNTGCNLTGDSLTKCNASGEWDKPAPACPIVDCGTPPNVIDGISNYTLTTYTSVVNYTCIMGYNLTGDSVLTCNAIGLWDKAEPNCTIVDCGPPSYALDGFVSYYSTTYQSDALYSCKTGYNLTGNSAMTCNSSGQWDQPFPTCDIVDCGQPLTPPNGTVNSSATTYQEIASFTCDAGFYVSGPARISCTANGVWNDTEPTCKIKDCGPPPNTTHGSVSYNSTVYESAAFYSCITGYNLTGNNVMTCNSSGQWDQPAPTCPIVDCGQPLTPLNGTANLSATTYQGIASFTCDTGFYVNGSTSLSCSAAGVWNDTEPTCEVIDCGPPPNIADGIADYTLTTYTSVVNYDCNMGYNLTGDSVLTCNASGMWDKAEPTCTIVDCGQPLTPLNGTANLSATTYQEIASFTCDAGFYVNGSTSLSCTAAGVWNDTEPACEIKDCGPPPNTTHGYANYTSTTYQYVAVYSCNTGYNLTGNSAITCNSSGQWDQHAPTCPIVGCGPPTPPVNGTAFASGTTHEAIAYFDCDDGFVLNGPAAISCDAAGVWNDSTPTCDIKDCGPPSAVTNGYVSFNTSTYSSAAIYTCNPGSNLTGDSVLVCNSSGMWNPPAPACQIVDCGPPATPANGGAVFTTTSFGATVNYTCDAGYQLTGVNISTCNASGVWDQSVPTCDNIDCGIPATPANGSAFYTTTTLGATVNYTCSVGFYIIGDNTRTCNASGHWNGATPLCDVINCGALASPANGNAFYTVTTFGAIVTYTCDAGFDITGASTRTCSANGIWNGTAATCVIKDCGPPATPANGNSAFTTTTFGATVSYTCDPGYNLTGAIISTCNASGLWSDTEPVCMLGGCGMLANPTDGLVTCPSQQIGDNCTFICNTGFNLVGASSVVCQADGTWDFAAPTCNAVFLPPCNVQWAPPATHHYRLLTTPLPDYILISTSTSRSALHCVTRCNAHARDNCGSGSECSLAMYDVGTRECSRFYNDTVSGVTVGCDATRVCYQK